MARKSREAFPRLAQKSYGTSKVVFLTREAFGQSLVEPVENLKILAYEKAISIPRLSPIASGPY